MVNVNVDLLNKENPEYVYSGFSIYFKILILNKC